MGTVIVRYKTKPAHADENAALIRAVFEELGRSSPEGVRYASYRLPDGVSFVHVGTVPAGKNALNSLPSFQAYTRDIEARCEEPPVLTEVETVGNYPS
jgi:hypothetical protein